MSILTAVNITLPADRNIDYIIRTTYIRVICSVYMDTIYIFLHANEDRRIVFYVDRIVG